MTRKLGGVRSASGGENEPTVGRREIPIWVQGQIGGCRKTPKTRCFKLSPAYLQARSAFVRKMEARLPARGHLAAEFFDLRTVKDSRGDRKHFPIFNRDVTLV